ncbi:putative bifunctional diguanylate cyclase/phosphodiesterase [Aureimonas leprariae]|uniref:EAL domain-containing protein n=1 Tax=Plantimonas leprariae TaxID=2615207 RepID=A0A7V7U020_9HYPH|nr:EAL domain-containing protein [Aureimonas leprariae]KAB0679971.1 EAL domain-containing protein [Aureimonas leprariae]
MPIRLKILLGCLCLTTLTIFVGVLAQSSQREIGELAGRLYDNSLVSTGALRSAQGGVMKLKAQVDADASGSEGEPLAKPLTERVDAALSAVEADLTIASNGSISEAGRNLVDQTRRRLGKLALSGQALTPRLIRKELLLAQDDIDAAVRVFAADAYDVKGEVGTTMQSSIARTQVALGGAAALTLFVAWLLTRTIVPSLRRAAALAKSIAEGNLTNAIDQTGGGETGELLSALATMQSNIAEKLDRFETTVASQADAFDAERSVRNGHLQVALETAAQGLCMFDAAGRITLVNPCFAEIFAHPDVKPGATLQQLSKLAELGPLLATARNATAFVHETADGRFLAVSKRKTADGGRVLTVDDVTRFRDTEARIDHATNHDGMTGLANRMALATRLQTIFADAERARRTVLLALDIEGFRAVNEAYGHPAGDALLKQVAGRLLELAEPDDIVARIGGDDFAFVRTDSQHPDGVEALAEAVLDLFRQPFSVDGRHVSVGVSIGIAPAKGESAEPGAVEALLRMADLALADASSLGRNRFRFFEPAMEAAAQQRRQTEADLDRALANGEFEMFYQPFVDVPMHTIAGFEALLRWRHPERGMVSPGEFIPIAEASGAIAPIGLWVLETACRQAAAWPTGLTLAVNLSPKQFESENLYADIAAIVKRTGFEPYRLQLEVTEGVFLNNSEHVMWTLTALRKLGIRISMDDFGTGYSSLGYLSRFPFDKVKIDQSFVRDLAKRENLMIVRAIIGLSKAMGISVMAEGVETRRQMETLVAESCAEMQGYHFATPMPLSDLPRFMMQFSLDRGNADRAGWGRAGTIAS